jgi:hypothetical protein
VSFAHAPLDEVCRGCDTDLSLGHAIACNMCTWVWHAACLDPPVTPDECTQAGLFCCSPACATEVHEFIESNL